VVDHKVDNDADTAFMAGIEHILKILQGAVIRIYVLVIGHIITMIGRGRENRHQPDTTDPQVGGGVGVTIVEVIEHLDDPTEVADAIAVTVLEGAHEDLIENYIVPPSLCRFRLWCLFRRDLLGRCGSWLGLLGFRPACRQQQADDNN
jgi:hypothetical protein